MNVRATITRIRPTAARLGTLVWLVAGIVVLAAALRAEPSRSAAAAPAKAAVPAPAKTAAPPALERKYTPSYASRSGKELVMVLVGASFCGAQRKPGFPQQVEDAKLSLQRQAAASGRQFSALAVSLDWETADALAFLEHFGEWDQMSVGRNWLNEGAIRYVWRDMPGAPEVPQILVIERDVEKGEQAITVRGDRVVKRLLGTAEIEAWVRGGAPI
ncbi:MAG TPA: hypothetical protein VHG08_04865 [Longimicrobium sp.]|nr:hypothetical protein [Longimicrobium sp.]